LFFADRRLHADIVLDIPNNVFSMSVTKSVISALDRDKSKHIISMETVLSGSLPLTVVATSAKFSVIDFYTGAVMFEHNFVKFSCTAMKVINDENRPLIVCGGNSKSLAPGTQQKFMMMSSGLEPVNHVIKIWDLITGQLIKTEYWESAIDSLLVNVDRDSKQQFIITVGFAAFHHHSRRIVCYNLTKGTKSVANAKETWKADNAGDFGTSLTPQNVTFAVEQINKRDTLIEIFGSESSSAGLNVRFYNLLPEVYSRGSSTVDMDIELWSTFRYQNQLETHKVLILQALPQDQQPSGIASKESSFHSLKVHHFHTRKLFVTSASSKTKTRSSVTDHYSLDIRQSTRNCYLMEGYGEKDLHYVAFVFLIDKSADFPLSSGKFGVAPQPQPGGKMSPRRSPRARKKIIEQSSNELSTGKLSVHYSSDRAASANHLVDLANIYPGNSSRRNSPATITPHDPNSSSYLFGRSKVVVYDMKAKKIYYEIRVTSKVTSIKFIASRSKSFQKQPLLLISGEDGVLLTWNFIRDVDIDDSENNMKIFREVIKEKYRDNFWLNRLLADDATKADGIEAFDTKYWLDNQKIFYEASDRKVESFIKEMSTYASKSIYILTRAMDIAIANKNPRIVKILLDYWLEILNQDVENKAFAMDWFHRPSAFLHMNTLLQLVAVDQNKVFYKEFSNFICQIKLLKSPEDLKRADESWEFSGHDITAAGCLTYIDTINVWRDKLQQKSRQSLDAFFIPLKDAANIQMLRAYVTVCAGLDDVSIFSSPVGIYATKFAWQKFGLRVHLLNIVSYAAFHILFTASVFNFTTWTRSGSYIEFVAIWLIEIVVGASIILFMINEYRQLQFAKLDDGAREASISDGIENYQRVTELFSQKVTILADISEQSCFYYPSISVKYLWNAVWKIFMLLCYPFDRLLSYFFIWTYCQFGFICTYFGFESSLLESSFISRDYYGDIVGYNHTITSIPRILVVYLPVLFMKVVWNMLCYLAAFLCVFFFKLFLFESFHIANIRVIIKHMSDFWNWIDVLIIAMGLPGTAIRFVYQHDNEYSRSFIAVASVATW
jgi:hypothetical protein